MILFFFSLIFWSSRNGTIWDRICAGVQHPSGPAVWTECHLLSALRRLWLRDRRVSPSQHSSFRTEELDFGRLNRDLIPYPVDLAKILMSSWILQDKKKNRVLNCHCMCWRGWASLKRRMACDVFNRCLGVTDSPGSKVAEQRPDSQVLEVRAWVTVGCDGTPAWTLIGAPGMNMELLAETRTGLRIPIILQSRWSINSATHWHMNSRNAGSE